MIRTIIRATLGILSLLAILTMFLALTPLGLPSSLKIANFLLPGDLKVTNLSGSILRKIEADHITYEDGELYIRLDEVSLDWKPGRLLFNRTLYIQDLHAKKVTLHTPSSDSPKERGELDLDIFTSDYTIILNRTNLYDLTWENYDINLERFATTVVINQRGMRIRDMYLLKDCNHFNLTANVGPSFTPAIQVEASQRLSFDQTQTVVGSTSILGDLEHLELEQVFTRGIIAELKIEARDIANHLAINAEGHAKIEDVNKINQNLSGNLRIDLNLGYEHRQGIGELHLTSTESIVNNLPLDVNFNGEIKNHIVYWKNNVFSLGNNEITTTGNYGRHTADINWKLAANNLGQVSSRMAGTLQSSGRLQQNKGNTEILGDLAANNFRFLDLRINKLQAPDLRWGDAEHATIKLQLDAHEIHYRDYNIGDFSLRADGTANNNIIDMKISAYNSHLHTSLLAEHSKHAWNGKLTRFDLNLLNEDLYTLAEVTTMHSDADRFVFDKPICVTSGKSQMCLNYIREQEDNQFSLNAQGIPTNVLSGFFDQQLVYLTGKLNLDANAQWESNSLPSSANLALNIDPGVSHLGRTQRRDWFEFGSSNITFNLDDKNLSTTGDLMFLKEDFVHWEAEVKNWPDVENARINASLKANIIELDPLRFFILQTDNFGAEIKADLHVDGPLLTPTFDGDLRLEKGHFDLTGYGITLTDASLIIEPDGLAKKLSINGQIHSDGKPLNITGEAHWQDQQPDVSLRFHGNDIKVSDTNEAVVYASPDILAHFNGRVLDITGELHIPTAKLRIMSYQKTLSPSPDVIILQEVQAERTHLFTINSNVLLSLGKNVEFKAGGLTTKLTDGIRITKRGETAPRASGQIVSKDGFYAAYGQRLEIDTGILSFNNSPLDNPALNIEATRKVTLVQRTSDQYIFSDPGQSGGDILQEGKVGVRITGTAQNPQYIMFSVPQLSEEDQLSYLLTGSPAGQLGAAQAAFMLAAIGDASNQLGFSDSDSASLQNITSNMGVDVSLAEGTRIDPETGEAVSDTNVVVGTALHPKLYVSYSVGLLDPINIFQVRYQLSRRFALQSITTSDGDTGGDIIYGIETDGFLWMGD